MNAGNAARIEMLGKDNYDTWKLQMQAILTKNDLWEYVNGGTLKPELGENNANAVNVREWSRNDAKARSDIILSISPSELKQIKSCVTSREMWMKLEETFQSRGPARKATLLKSLTLQKMVENGDVRAHLNSFFDSVDKLNDMEIEINPDLLSILLLYSLPSSFENFRCAIESRDELPTPDALRIKIKEESDARKNGSGNTTTSGAMFVKKNNGWQNQRRKGDEDKHMDKKSTIRCFRCKKPGHKAFECPKNKKESAKVVDDVCLNVSTRKIVEPSRKWCLDSGATTHLCNEAQYFDEVCDTRRGTLKLASDATTVTGGEGKVRFIADINGDKKDVTLENALYVPDLRTNLLSVSKITDRGFDVHFQKDGATVRDAIGNVVLFANRVDDLYYVPESSQDARSATSVRKETKVSLETLHRRLGHVNVRDILESIRKGIVKGVQLIDVNEKLNCDTCSEGKMTRTPFPVKSERQTKILDLVHTDVCGPMRATSLAGAKYFVEFIDDCSRWCEVKFLKSKAETFKATTDYIALVENQKGTTVKCLQSDNGREYTSNEFCDYLKTRGITRRLTVPHNPEQNGTAERKNRTLNDVARCLLRESNLPNSFWAEAVNTANYLRNRLPTKSLNGRTPFEAWTGKIPDISGFRVFGSKVYYLDRTNGKGKFDPRGLEGIFLGYAEESKAYRIWSSEKRQVLISRDVKFLEDKILAPIPKTPFLSNDKTEGENSKDRQFMEFEFPSHSTAEGGRAPVHMENENSEFQEADDDILEEGPMVRPETRGSLRRGPGRPRKVKTGSRGRPRKQYSVIPENNEEVEQVHLSEVPMNEALNGPDANEWCDAIADEMCSLLEKETWVMVDRPEKQKVVGCRMILRNKLNPDGSIEKRKARLVAQGFSQQPGIHFTETFAPVARRSSIRLLASLAATHGMKIRQLDVKTAYLNGVLEEEVYMEPPKNLHEILKNIVNSNVKGEVVARAKKMLLDISKGNKVCLLKKSLYGLRQAGRSWYTRLNETMKTLGLTPSKSDPCFFYIGKGEDITLVSTYVDDILIASRNEEKITELIDGLTRNFEIKDSGNVKYCLGIEFEQSKGVVMLHQRGYVRDLLSRFGMTDSNPVSTPVDPGSKLTKNDTQTLEDLKLPYRELVGALTYLATTTRPDISFAASYLGQYNNCFGADHWKAAKRVLRYLKGSIDLGLIYGSNPGSFVGYADADWGNCSEDRKSYTGYLFMLNGGPVAWDSRKQRTVALSTLEAEYMALSEGAKEAIFLRRFIAELGFGNSYDLIVYGDNRGSLILAENQTYHSRSKHIDIRHHFVRDVLKQKELKLVHVPTEDQAADFLTKGLPKAKHQRCIELSGLGNNRLEGKC